MQNLSNTYLIMKWAKKLKVRLCRRMSSQRLLYRVVAASVLLFLFIVVILTGKPSIPPVRQINFDSLPYLRQASVTSNDDVKVASNDDVKVASNAKVASNGNLKFSTAIALFRDLTYVSNDKGELVRDNHKLEVQGKKKLILHYQWPVKHDGKTKVREPVLLKHCLPLRCELTDDNARLHLADAVIINMFNDQLPPSPPSTPTQRRGQVWVAMGDETPLVGKGITKGAAQVWKDVFHWDMSYRTDSDVFRPYSTFFVRQYTTRKNFTQIALKKTVPAAWFVSHCHTPSKRDLYVSELQKHIRVDVYGQCGTFKCSPFEYNPFMMEVYDECGRPNCSPVKRINDTCMPLLNSTYYFYLSFENSFCRDYVTLKFFKTYRADVIPVVRGGADYSRYFPAGTYINTADFRSPRELAAHLHALMADTARYASMLKSKDRFKVMRRQLLPDVSLCRLCEKLNQPLQPPLATRNVFNIFQNKSECYMPTDL